MILGLSKLLQAPIACNFIVFVLGTGYAARALRSMTSGEHIRTYLLIMNIVKNINFTSY